MSEEKNVDPSKNEEDEQDYKDLDDILDDADEKEEDKGKGEEADEDKSEDKNKNKDEDEQKFYKKVGNREFTSEEDYDAFVIKTYGINGNLAGEVKKLGGDPKLAATGKSSVKKEEKAKETKEKTEQKQLSDEDIYYRAEKVRFSRMFPESNDYKEEMALSLRNGKANINGEPSFALAFARSLRADNKPIPEKLLQRIKSEKGVTSEKPAAKRVMRSGGSNSATSPSGQNTYREDELEGTSDFGNDVALGNIGPY